MRSALGFVLVLAAAAACQQVHVNEVSSPTGGSSAIVDQIVVIPPFIETVNGQTFQLSAQAFAGSLPLSGIPIQWASTNPAVANILTPSTTGSVTVKAEGVGEAEIIARSGVAEGRSRVKVRPASE